MMASEGPQHHMLELHAHTKHWLQLASGGGAIEKPAKVGIPNKGSLSFRQSVSTNT